MTATTNDVNKVAVVEGLGELSLLALSKNPAATSCKRQERDIHATPDAWDHIAAATVPPSTAPVRAVSFCYKDEVDRTSTAAAVATAAAEDIDGVSISYLMEELKTGTNFQFQFDFHQDVHKMVANDFNLDSVLHMMALCDQVPASVPVLDTHKPIEEVLQVVEDDDDDSVVVSCLTVSSGDFASEEGSLEVDSMMETTDEEFEEGVFENHSRMEFVWDVQEDTDSGSDVQKRNGEDMDVVMVSQDKDKNKNHREESTAPHDWDRLDLTCTFGEDLWHDGKLLAVVEV